MIIRYLINILTLAIFLFFVSWYTNGDMLKMLYSIGCLILFELSMLRDSIIDIKKNVKKPDWNDYV